MLNICCTNCLRNNLAIPIKNYTELRKLNKGNRFECEAFAKTKNFVTSKSQLCGVTFRMWLASDVLSAAAERKQTEWPRRRRPKSKRGRRSHLKHNKTNCSTVQCSSSRTKNSWYANAPLDPEWAYTQILRLPSSRLCRSTVCRHIIDCHVIRSRK